MGGLFGVYNNYDHTTLIHGLQTFSNDLEHEDELKKHVEAIMTRITETNE